MEFLAISLSVIVAVHAVYAGSSNSPGHESSSNTMSAAAHSPIILDNMLVAVKHETDTAVIFHTMPGGSGRNLFLDELQQNHQSGSIRGPGVNIYDGVKYNDGSSTLYVINVDHIERCDPDQVDHNDIAAALSFIDDHNLALTSIYITIDANAVMNEDYVNNLYHYVANIVREYRHYGPLSDDQIKLVFTMHDLDMTRLPQLVAIVNNRLRSVLMLNHDVIAISASLGTQQVIADLKKAIVLRPLVSYKNLNQISLRQQLLKSQIKMENIQLNRDQQKLRLVQDEFKSEDCVKAMFKMLNCTSTLIIENNYMPDVSILKLPKSDKDGEIRWTLDWMMAGAKRVALASHLFGHSDYQDTKAGYDSFVQHCSQKKDQLYRYGDRIKNVSLMKDQMSVLNATGHKYMDLVQEKISSYEHDVKIRTNVLAQTNQLCSELGL